MGTFRVTIEIGDIEGLRFQEADALVDSGATFTVVPASFLNRLGVAPTRQEPFEYADGRRAQVDMAEARVRINGKETTTWVIFGEEGGYLLGAVTLEEMLLSIDLVCHRLVPAQGLLIQARHIAEPPQTEKRQAEGL